MCWESMEYRKEIDMPPPKKGEPGYEKYREEYNARRRKRREDPEYRARYSARMRAQRARRRAEESERRYGEG